MRYRFTLLCLLAVLCVSDVHAMTATLTVTPTPGQTATPTPVITPNITQYNKNQFRQAYEDSVAPSGSEAFVPLSDPLHAMHFRNLLEAMLRNDLTVAAMEIYSLESLGVMYHLVEVTNAADYTIGFMESVLPGDPAYHGWGAALVRPVGPGYVVYQGPHTFADLYSEDIVLQAFYENANGRVLILTGAHRFANGDADGDSWPDGDAAHDPHSIFHLLTDVMALHGHENNTPYWFIQIHGSADRDTEPDIVGSDCSPHPAMTSGSQLVLIDDAVDAAGTLSMGVWGWWEGLGDTEDGVYYLNGVGNIQRDLLAAYGLHAGFMHFELERHIRDEYNAESGPGYTGIQHLLDTIKSTLSSQFVITPTPTQTPTVTPTPTITATPDQTATPTPSTLPASRPAGLAVTLLALGILLAAPRRR